MVLVVIWAWSMPDASRQTAANEGATFFRMLNLLKTLKLMHSIERIDASADQSLSEQVK
jgi:hypothetical protein